MKLLVDVGNQYLKWCLVGGAGAESVGVFPATDENLAGALQQAWSGLPHPASIWISCVAGDKLKVALEQWLRERWAVDPVWVVAQESACGVRNGYRNPTELGSDRWLALIGARARAPSEPAIVVDCGTAITVDGLEKDGYFPGGVIMPGLRMMIASLYDGTRRIRAQGRDVEPVDHSIVAFGCSTAEAVKRGALCAVVGGIERAISAQSVRLGTSSPYCFLAGGDARLLQPLLRIRISLEPDLVLQGLAVYANSNR